MGSISSINFKKSTSFQVFHNSSIRSDYAIGGELAYTLKGYEALKLKEKIIAKAMQDYTQHIGQKFKAKSYEWSAVVNLKPESTMQDCENLAKFFEEKYGFQCYQIAIHRDEGHIDERGEKVINHHAHLEFVTLDRKTGKNNYRRELITPSVLRQMQTEVAEILQMERGQDKRLTGVNRIEPRKYAQMKEQEKKLLSQERKKTQMAKAESYFLQEALISEKEKKERLELERKAWIVEKTHNAQEYKMLRALREKDYQNIQELESAIADLNAKIEQDKKKTDTILNSIDNALKIDTSRYNNNEALQMQIEAIQTKPKEAKQKARNRFLNFWKNIKKTIRSFKKTIQEQDLKIKALEADLRAERQKNDFRTISDTQNNISDLLSKIDEAQAEQENRVKGNDVITERQKEIMRQEVKNILNLHNNTKDNTKPLKKDFER